MKAFWTQLAISLTAALRSPRTWVLTVVLALVFLLAGRFLPAEEQAAPVQVGVAAPSADDPLWQLLQNRSGTVVEFILTDSETIDAKVATSQWDCGVLIPGDLMERLEAGDVRRLLTIRTGPGSVVYPVVQETLSACVMQLASASIGEHYLADSGILSREEAALAGDTLYEELTDDQRVQVFLKTLDGNPMDAFSLAADHHGRLLRGLLALVLLAAALYLAQDLGTWMDSPAGRRLAALRSPLFLLLPRALGGMLGAGLGAALALALLPRGAGDLPALILYLLVLLALAMILSRLRRCFGLLPVLLPFVLLAAALLSPMVSLLPRLEPLAALTPVTLFLRACEGSAASYLALTAEAALLLGLTALFKRTRC